jgi:hypothetical protein
MTTNQLIAMLFPVFGGLAAVTAAFAGVKWIAPPRTEQLPEGAGAAAQPTPTRQPVAGEAFVLDALKHVRAAQNELKQAEHELERAERELAEAQIR